MPELSDNLKVVDDVFKVTCICVVLNRLSLLVSRRFCFNYFRLISVFRIANFRIASDQIISPIVSPNYSELEIDCILSNMNVPR